jgi:hypothetical protein
MKTSREILDLKLFYITNNEGGAADPNPHKKVGSGSASSDELDPDPD